MSQTHHAANQPLFNERGLLDANIPAEADIQASMLRQPGQSFEQWMASRVARFETRRYDWDALKFQADFDPKYRRAQMRYVGTGGTGVASDNNTVRGTMKVICEKDGERWESVLRERDLISVPPGVYREEINVGEEDALMCVMLGSPKPITPVYPPDSPLAAFKRNLTKA